MTIGRPDSETEKLRVLLSTARSELTAARAGHQVAQDHAEMLQAELQHRVRNMLAVVRSVFSRTVAAGGSLEDVSDHFHGRLETLARYQSFLLGDIHSTVDLEQMVREEFHAFRFGDDPKIAIKGPEVGIGQDAAQLIALALHELSTNSIKFGALSTLDDRAGVKVTWRVSDDLVTIRWAEHGVAVVTAAPLRRGFGREYIEQALPYQSGATTSFELRAGGVVCSITMPLTSVGARSGPFP